MKYSIIIPVYNCVRDLPACLSGISELSCRDWELLLIDDGSTDGSGEVCRKFAESDSRIRFFTQENQGVSAARNRGIRESRGQWILFADADDTLDTKELSRLLKSSPAEDLVIFGHSFDFYSHGICYQRQMQCWPQSETLSFSKWGSVLAPLYGCNGLSPVWNKVFNKQILERNCIFFRETMFQYEDLDFSLRYLACCQNIFLYAPPIYRYHLQEENHKTRKRMQKLPDFQSILSVLEEDLLALSGKNPAVSHLDIQKILLHLYLHLARETAQSANLRKLKQMSRDFQVW